MTVSSLAPDDFAWLPATEQLAALDAKDVSSAELVELYLSRISTHNPSLNAIVTVDPDAARRAATEADAARSRGDDLGPLHGLPITVKDSYETAGMRTVCGRPDLADYVPTQDAEAVARLRRSGAIIVGKTNMPTGNADVQASNPVFGRTNNPWDRSRTSGGSAGGGAAATAAGLTSFDYGSEIGGSTRIPAHFCGLYGHKSTWQSVPLVGHIPGGPGDPGRWGEADMACAGVQARGARDIIPALEATVGPLNPDGGFSYTLAPPRATALKDFRVAVWADDPDCPVDNDVRRAIDDAVTALRDAGARVVEHPASIPVDHRYLTRTLPEPGDGRVLGRPVHDQPALRRCPCPALPHESSRRRRRRTAGNNPKPSRVVVPRRGSSRDRAALGRVLQRVRRAAAARHTHRCARPPQQGP